MILGAFESNAGAVGSQIAQRFHQRLAIGGISYGDRGIFQRSGVTFVEQHLPVVSQNGENTQLDLAIPSCSLAIAIWGRIDNSRELWKSLDPDHAPASNRLLLALCYRKWGTDMGSHLIGDFTFAIFDWEKQTCLLVRDQMGTRPVFYTQTGSNVYFSSSLGELKALGLLSGRLDKQWLTQSIERSVGFPAVPLTAFPDAKRLPPGSALIIQKNSCKEVKYYNFPTKRVNENSEEEQIFEYRKRFEQAVKRRIPDGNLPIAVELSGGLDSSSIAAAIHSFAHKNVSLHALSTHEFTEDEKFIDFAKTNMPAMSYHLADRWDQAPDIWHENYQRCAGHPSSIPYNLQNGHLITIAQSLGASTIFNGAGGDEITTASGEQVRSQMLHERRFLDMLSSYDAGLLKKLAHLSHFATKSLMRSVIAAKTGHFLKPPPNKILKPEVWEDRLIRNGGHSLYKENWKNFNLGLIRSRWQSAIIRFESDTLVAQIFGMQSAAPMLDRNLIEHYFAMPLTSKFKATLNRSVHRNAMRAMIPETIRLGSKDRGELTKETIYGHHNMAQRLHSELPKFDNLPDQISELISQTSYNEMVESLIQTRNTYSSNTNIVTLGMINKLSHWIKKEL